MMPLLGCGMIHHARKGRNRTVELPAQQLMPDGGGDKTRINRAARPADALAAAVAERLGFDCDTASDAGAGRGELGKRLGEGEQLHINLLGRANLVAGISDRLRAVSNGQARQPGKRIEKYLASKFGRGVDDAASGDGEAGGSS